MLKYSKRFDVEEWKPRYYLLLEGLLLELPLPNYQSFDEETIKGAVPYNLISYNVITDDQFIKGTKTYRFLLKIKNEKKSLTLATENPYALEQWVNSLGRT